MRKLRTVLCTLALVAVCVFALPTRAEAAKEGDYTYKVSGGKATVTGYTGTEKKLVIPSALGGYPVTAIGSSAFNCCYDLTSVTIPDGVTTIGHSAFSYCDNLISVKFPDSVTTIGPRAFSCTSLTKIIIPNSVKSIGEYAFYACGKLTKVTLPSGMRTISEYMFLECLSLTSLKIPDSVTSVGEGAFSCTGFKTFTVPSNVSKIGKAAFFGCNNLAKVTFNNKVTSVEEETFYGCPVLKKVTFGSKLKKIGASAFAECIGLTSIKIPSSVTAIGDSAFYGCTGLTTVITGNGVKVIGGSAFAECTNLTTVSIGSKVTTIGESAFSNCNALNSFSVAKNNAKYASEGGVLFNKKKTEVLQVPKSLSGSYTIPSSVTVIGGYTFAGCAGLTSVKLPEKLIAIGENAFEFCTGLSQLTIPNGVKTIGDRAFYGCSKLAAVKIGSKVTTIGSHAFTNCALVEIIIPNSVTTIGNYAFSDCKKLEYVMIGTGLKTVGRGAFGSVGYLSGDTYKVYYAGSSSKWNKIDFSYGNERLTWAKVKYNHTHKFKSGKCTGCDYQPVAVKITIQPENVKVTSGQVAKVTVNATGDGLKYQWYYAAKGSSKFKKISGATAATYSAKMSSKADGRKVYCEVTDQYDNTVKTKTVTLHMGKSAKITTQPKNGVATQGSAAKITLKATGDGLTYTWYYKLKTAKSWTKAAVKTNTFVSGKMSGKLNGCKVQCVIKDQYGNIVKSDIVTLKMK